MNRPATPHDELWTLDATAQAELVRQGAASARELVSASLARIAALNPELNAVVGLQAEAALARAEALDAPSGGADEAARKGPFAGVPFLTKDLLAYPGQRAAMGSRLMAQMVPAEHSPYTRRLEEAGLVCLGKSTSSELGLLGSTECLLDGTTHSPWGPELSAGGSSGGAAAAVAAGLVPFAHASDGGGSIRGPAALNGLFGFKPSGGATVPAVAEVNDFVRLVSEHCVSRSVRDSDILLAWTSAGSREPVGRGPVEPLTIGVYDRTAFGVGPEAEAAAALEETTRLCEALGHEVVAVDPPGISGEALSFGFFVLAGAAVAGLSAMVEPMLGRPPGPAELEPATLALRDWFLAQGPDAYPRALAELESQARAMRAFLEGVDVALCPTTMGPRPRLGHLAPDLPLEQIFERTHLLAGTTSVHNPTGAPAMSVPLCWTEEGLPVGMMFAASPGQDARLMRLAYQLEEARPWVRFPDLARSVGA